MATRVDWQRLWSALSHHLVVSGPSSSAELTAVLGVSQATFSRLVRAHQDELLVIGRARSTRYALRRNIPSVGEQAPIYEVDEQGGARHVAQLYAVAPDRFYVETFVDDMDSRFYDDLPWFLSDMCPSGFLGRLVPRMHPDLELPEDVRLWSADQCLRYLVHYGADLPGAFIVGEPAFRLHLAEPPPAVAEPDRARAYAQMAGDVLAALPPGSSAGGEQPKFLARRLPGAVSVLVKFSPPTVDATGVRLADLLAAEHIAHGVLEAHGHRAAESELLRGDDRAYLEVERFDRTPAGGRRGTISFLALDAEYVGRMRRWSETARILAKQGHLDHETADRLLWLEWFGHLIANTDMHFGNVAFFTRGTRISGLAPVYDMVPMWFAPEHGHFTERPWAPPAPDPAAGSIWDGVCEAAEELWSRVAHHPLVSSGFRAIADENRLAVNKARSLGARLPR